MKYFLKHPGSGGQVACRILWRKPLVWMERVLLTLVSSILERIQCKRSSLMMLGGIGEQMWQTGSWENRLIGLDFPTLMLHWRLSNKRPFGGSDFMGATWLWCFYHRVPMLVYKLFGATLHPHAVLRFRSWRVWMELMHIALSLWMTKFTSSLKRIC